MVAGTDETYRLAFELGQDAIESQARVLSETRERVGTVLSAASVTIGLAVGLGGSSADRLSGLGEAGAVVAGVGFVVLIVHSVMVWWPVAVTLNLDAGALVGSFAERDPAMGIGEMHRELALHLGRHTQANRVRIDARLQWFTRCLVGLLIEVAGLVMLLLDIAR